MTQVKVSYMWPPDNSDPNGFAKVQMPGERFWVKDAVVIDSHTMVATVDNDLVYYPEIKCGDRVMFMCNEKIHDCAYPMPT